MRDSTLRHYVYSLNDRVRAMNKHYASIGCDEQLEYFTFQTVAGCKLIAQELETATEGENISQDGELSRTEINRAYRYYGAVERELDLALAAAKKNEKVA